MTETKKEEEPIVESADEQQDEADSGAHLDEQEQAAREEGELEAGDSEQQETASEEPQEGGGVEGSDFLKSAMQDALESVEAIERGEEPGEKKKKKKKESPPPPSKKELELKMQIIDLQHKVRELEKEVENKIKEVKQNFDEAKRIQKRLEDYKTRVMREKADQFNYGQEPLIREILPALDSLERAMEHATGPEQFGALHEGIELTLRQFLSALGKFGVERLEAKGEPFNPGIHEAMGMCENSEVEPNTVVEEHQKGYKLKDRLIRPSRVIISCPPQGAPDNIERPGAEKTGGAADDSGQAEESAPSEEAPDNGEQQ